MEEAQDPFYLEEDAEVESDGRREQVTPQALAETMWSFNERLIKAQKEQDQINAAILQSITNIQQKAQWGSNPRHDEGTKSTGIRSKSYAWEIYPSPHRGSCNKMHEKLESWYSIEGLCDSPHSSG